MKVINFSFHKRITIIFTNFINAKKKRNISTSYILIYRFSNIMCINRNYIAYWNKLYCLLKIIYITYIYFLLILFINWSFNLWKMFKYHKHTRHRAERIITRIRMSKCLHLAYIGRQKNVQRTLLVFGNTLIARHYILFAPDATQRLLSDFKSCVCAAVCEADDFVCERRISFMRVIDWAQDFLR